MLNILIIKNIALVDQIEIEFGPGLSLLTGETGSGKSILVDALSLVLGARAGSDTLRSGEAQGSVEASFDLTPAARALLDERALPADSGELVLRRELSATGRGRASINGALVPVAVLRELAPRLVTIYGQHEPQGLLDPLSHLERIDRFAEVPRDDLRSAYQEWREQVGRLEALRSNRREQERRRETLAFQAAEIEKAELLVDEEATLRQEKLVCQNSDRLVRTSTEAFGLLYEQEGSALERLRQVFRRVEELASIDPRFQDSLRLRGELVAGLEDLAFTLRDYSGQLEMQPGRLDEIEGRLALIERLKRKYGSSVEEVLAFAARCRDELDRIGSPEDQERELEARIQTLATRYLGIAREASGRRRQHAKELEKRMERELRQLAMERTRFRVGFSPVEAGAEDPGSWTEAGLEGAEFLLAPNPGEELRPMARIASGGELSRLLLALSCAAPVEDVAASLVFDEVDAGIGGRVAEVVGRKLQQLSAGRQVLCVTHLPQIAAFADAHYSVQKGVKSGRTLTSVTKLANRERIDELARMLGGESVGPTARQHAREMLQAAEARVTSSS